MFQEVIDRLSNAELVRSKEAVTWPSKLKLSSGMRFHVDRCLHRYKDGNVAAGTTLLGHFCRKGLIVT